MVCDEIGGAGRAQWCRPWVEFGFDSLPFEGQRKEVIAFDFYFYKIILAVVSAEKWVRKE